METTSFVRELETFKAERLSRMVAAGQTSLGDGPADTQRLLEVALTNEISVSELAAAWTPSTPEIDVKIALRARRATRRDTFSSSRSAWPPWASTWPGSSSRRRTRCFSI
jgi:hypothetical protein